MKTYTFWFSETYTMKAGFKANSLEEAKALINDVFEGERDVQTLPEFWMKDKGFDCEYSPETLEEWDE